MEVIYNKNNGKHVDDSNDDVDDTSDQWNNSNIYVILLALSNE